MSEPETAPVIRRILVALDASPDSLAALQAAVRLAARMEAELLGLFVEDVNLLRVAESPFAREILYPSARETPVSRSSMELLLRRQSEQARAALESAAQRAQVRCVFRTVRGQVASELLSAAAEADLLAMGKLGWSLGSQLRMGSTALELVASTIPLLLLCESGAPVKPRLVVYYDDSPQARRALLAAAELAKADSGSMTVLLAATGEDAALSMQNAVQALLRDRELELQFHRIDPTDEIAVLNAIRAEETAMFVVGGREPFQKLPALEVILRERKIPVLLLRNGSKPESK
jgi:nucleotide-binding universal stress UspA family protein